MSLSLIGSRKRISFLSDAQDPEAKRFQGLCRTYEAKRWVLAFR